MNESLLTLKPADVWRYFSEILSVPRPSKHEEKIVAYLETFARNHKLEFKRDAVGNVLICKNASPGYEDRQTVVLQSHIDMVCEKNSDKEHDFFNDPIESFIENGWVKAKGTTLGADDGIGVAAQLAILSDKSLSHGPIECLFTVDEETGLTGAFGLEPDFLKGKILLNLDSEDEGELFIGCAGGKDTVAKMPFSWEKSPDNFDPLVIEVSGLKGGHSGDDIHKGLGNANKILTRILWMLSHETGARLFDISGGNLRNAIAREAQAKVFIDKSLIDKSLQIAEELANKISAELAVTEPNLRIRISIGTEHPGWVVALSDQKKLLNSLYACPHGVIAYSQTIPGFVETSTNLASVRMHKDHWEITTSQRSSVESAKEDVANMVAACFALAGADIKQSNGYPGWAPNPSSAIRELTVKSYVKLFGSQPLVKAIHAGLECGLIGDKYPGMDMISYGPTIKGAHSPDERLEIVSVQKFWDLTLEILKEIPKK
jgi:dipeptidase D